MEISLIQTPKNQPQQVKDIDKETWDLYANQAYDQVVSKSSFYKKLLRDSILFLNPCQNILDIGCGTGNFSIKLSKMGKKVISLDNNPTMLSHLHAKIKKNNLMGQIKVVNGNIQKILKGEKEVFDGILMINVLNTLNDFHEVLTKIWGLLKPGGRFVLASPKTKIDPAPFNKCLEKEFSGKNKLVDNLVEIVKKVNQVLIPSSNHLFSTQEIEEILINRIGFSKILSSDSKETKFSQFFGQIYFVVVEKGMETSHPKNIEYRECEILEEKIQTLKSRYYAFTKISPDLVKMSAENHEMKMELDNFDYFSKYYVASENGKILAQIRLVLDSDYKLPIDHYINLDSYRKKGFKLAYPSRWLKESFAPKGTGLNLFKRVHLECLRLGITHWVSLIFREDMALYKKFTPNLENLVLIPINVPTIGKEVFFHIVDIKEDICFP